MTDTKQERPGPIEVWLSKPNIEVTCRIVREDETDTTLDVGSLSMRGAQREITAWLIRLGYAPAGRWETAASDGYTGVETVECMRLFKPGDEAQRV